MVKPVSVEPTLLDRIEAYLVRHGIPPTRFSKLVLNSPTLVDRLRKGLTIRDVTLARIEAVLAHPPRVPTRGAIVAARYRQTMIANAEIERVEWNRRNTDPLELAATFLRRKGWMVVRARVIDETATGWALGRLRVDDEGLLQRARNQGWTG